MPAAVLSRDSTEALWIAVKENRLFPASGGRLKFELAIASMARWEKSSDAYLAAHRLIVLCLTIVIQGVAFTDLNYITYSKIREENCGKIRKKDKYCMYIIIMFFSCL